MGHPIGKRVGEHLYFHISFLDDETGLPHRLRREIERAWSVVKLTPVVRDVQDRSWNLVKLHVRRNEVTFLWYPDFSNDPHPALHRSLRVAPESRTPVVLTFWRPDGTDTPILHRKELFLPQDHYYRHVFAGLTREEEKAGLYERPSLIGRKGYWEALLRRKGLKIVGHKLIRTR